jgi:P4 family phage/plasmid primase-like protien
MNTTTIPSTLYEFLKDNKASSGENGSNYTHTRIGNGTDIMACAYSISPEKLQTFYRLYCDHVFKYKRSEYLTEKQIPNGPILVDLDFRYEYSICEHQYGDGHIFDIVELYLEEIKTLLQIDENSSFEIFVMEKQNVNRVEAKNYTKDGIHIIFGVQMDHVMQQMLRQRILKKIPEICDIPIINTWETVLDEGISTGKIGWQLYGSKKPDHEAYKLTKWYIATMDDSGSFELEEQDSEFDVVANFEKLSVQYTGNPKFEINVDCLAEYNQQLMTSQKRAPTTTTTNPTVPLVEINSNNYVQCIDSITCIEELRAATEAVLNSLNTSMREIHDYTQILPEQYYQPGSHLLNRKVAFALKHTDDRLFLSWVMLRSKADDFDYGDIPNLYREWSKMSRRNNGITKKSIVYWAKQDAYEAYMNVKQNMLSTFIEKSVQNINDYDMAMVLYQMYKEKYICASITHKQWYVFHNHRWVIDRGQTLRKAISQEMFIEYSKYQAKCIEELGKLKEEDEETNEKAQNIKKTLKNVATALQKCKQSSDKDHMMKEALELFYDDNFIKNMDANKYLLCFTNGVIDFDADNEFGGRIIFRDGYPQDYITKTTGIPYIPASTIDKVMEKQIIQFMEEIFPDPELRNYMWDHLASCLIGTNLNQTFNIYVGSGSNGKSLLTDLMKHTLGDYTGIVPITLVTEKRTGIGGVSPELIQLKGVRYAVMQEPSKDMRVNEGMMKQLTGGDPLQGRALYCDSETFDPQFKLVVCTNSLLDFNSNDDGTWRRIRKCDFESKFMDIEDYKEAEKDGKTFLKDKTLKDKMPKWASVFASMLVSRAYVTKGNVAECDRIMNSSKQYRQSQDPFSAFINDKIVVCEKTSMPLTEMELKTVFKEWMRESYPGYKYKLPELYAVIIKKFGKQEGKGWVGIRLNEQIVEAGSDGDM